METIKYDNNYFYSEIENKTISRGTKGYFSDDQKSWYQGEFSLEYNGKLYDKDNHYFKFFVTENGIVDQDVKYLNGREFENEIEIQVYPEVCCGECNDIIHNHIDCPICKNDYAGTNQYGELHGEKELSCSECGTVFQKVSESWYSKCKVKIISATVINQFRNA